MFGKSHFFEEKERSDVERRNEFEWVPFFSIEESLEELNFPPSLPVYN
jgi:hypothetical protein